MKTTKFDKLKADNWQVLTQQEQKDINGGMVIQALALSFVVAYYAGYAYGRSQR